MGRFGFPFGLFGLIIGDGTLLGSDHGAVVDPADSIDHTYYFGIVKNNVDIFVPFHRHVIHGHQHLLTIVSIECLNL